MRAVNIHGPGDVRLDNIDTPAPGPRDAVVRIAACGICGTDLGYIRQGGLGGRARSGPMPLGHEAAGVVEAVGAEVKDITPSMRVIVNPMVEGGVIGNGGPEGAFADRLLVRGAALGKSLHPMPADMDFEVGALAEPLGVALHAVNRGAPKPGEKAVVFGAGPIGLGVVLWLRRRGVNNIVSIDLSPARLEKARTLGASGMIDASRENVATRLAELQGRETIFGSSAVGTDLFIDAAGAPTILPDVIAMAKHRARLVIVAVHTKPVLVDLRQFLTREMSVTSAIGYPEEFPEVVAALAEMGEEARKLISHRFAFDNVLEALEAARSGNSAKIMVAFDKR